VRIALALKGLETAYHGVNIRAGAQYEPHYVNDLNPNASVPTLDRAAGNRRRIPQVFRQPQKQGKKCPC